MSLVNIILSPFWKEVLQKEGGGGGGGGGGGKLFPLLKTAENLPSVFSTLNPCPAE